MITSRPIVWFDGVVCMSSRYAVYAVVWFDEAEGKRGLTLGVMTVVDFFLIYFLILF